MIHDFADWLSPMLVKELRQGMRSKVLTSSLFILQGLLIFNVIIAFTVAEVGADTQGTTAFFWSILSLPLMIILPLSALASVGGEIKNNTLELIFLTRLNAWRIVLGKWIAIVAQSLLLAVTVLPYIALRYYLGGVNMLQDFKAVGGLLLASAVFTAVIIGVSPFQSKIIRIFIFLGLFFFLQVGGSFAAVFFMGGRGAFGVLSGGGIPDWKLYAGVALFLPIFVLLMLGLAASKIAPQAENHAGPRRFFGLLLLLICGFTSIFARDATALLVVGQVIIAPICLGALSEGVVTLSSLYRPFVKRGWLGKIAARIFTPGWQTGFLYTLLVLAILIAFWMQEGLLDFKNGGPGKGLCISLVAFGATILFPAALTPSSVKKRWLGFLIFTTTSALFLFITSVIGGITNSEIAKVSLAFPPIAIFVHAFDSIYGSEDLLLSWLLVLFTFSVVFLCVKIIRPFREMKTLLVEADRPLPNHDS